MLHFWDNPETGEDKHCDRHKDRESICVIDGDADCYYCGNMVAMCQECLSELIGDLKKYLAKDNKE